MVDERPRDWLRPTTVASSQRPAPAAAAVVAAAAPALPGQIDLFRDYLGASDSLPYSSPSSKRVCPSGDPASGLMIMTAMPEAEDCEAGSLISGAAGRLFDRMLAAIGRSRDSIYLASLSCLRAPSGRLSGPEAGQCAALARHHIGLVSPEKLLLLGDDCAKALLGLSVAQARGRWHEIATHAGPVRAIVTMPPDYLLRQQGAKAYVWSDLQMLVQG
jgi:DNA polymerase